MHIQSGLSILSLFTSFYFIASDVIAYYFIVLYYILRFVPQTHTQRRATPFFFIILDYTVYCICLLLILYIVLLKIVSFYLHIGLHQVDVLMTQFVFMSTIILPFPCTDLFAIHLPICFQHGHICVSAFILF